MKTVVVELYYDAETLEGLPSVAVWDRIHDYVRLYVEGARMHLAEGKVVAEIEYVGTDIAWFDVDTKAEADEVKDRLTTFFDALRFLHVKQIYIEGYGG